MDAEGLVHLRAGGVSLVVDTRGNGLPRVVHWGADLGALDAADLLALSAVSIPPTGFGPVDQVVPLSIVPEQSAGWLGTPGLSGHRTGRDFSARFVTERVESEQGSGPIAHRLTISAADEHGRLGISLEIEMAVSGLVRLRATLSNDDPGLDYTLDGLLLTLPVPLRAQEILDFSGRHLRERSPQRHAFTQGTHQRDNRRGRTGGDATLLLLAGAPAFSFEHGEVWGLHVAWSGNHRTLAERNPDGVGLLGGGELLLPGEGTLAPGESYTSPWVFGSWGRGLNDLSARFHDYLRARPQHPGARRPVVLNTWEAVYFDQDVNVLTELADLAAEIGVERFVLDDGWFRHRRDDHAGLGDWYVDESVWPGGLHGFADHIREAGMQFGLWFEPEMINVDSDLARAHPEWILSAGYRLPPEGRHQQVLDLAEPGAFAYILERMSALITEYGIAYIKWDHNRDLVEPGRAAHGRAGVHEQTRAVYRLIDTLKSRHPGLEIESCSSGGARADLGILDRTERIWASDCIDALERQQIERWTGLLLPPEMMGSHVGSPASHATARVHDLAFRAGTALFGSFGIEWDLRSASPADRQALAEWTALYQQHQELLHTGRVIHVDHPDPALQVHGVVAADSAEALFTFVAVATSAQTRPGPVRVPGLAPDADYQVTPLPLTAEVSRFLAGTCPPWWTGGITLPGRVLAEHGVQLPALFPERLILVHFARV
ncbi:alpha-galactosidase [Streptosporangium sp. NBC_01639]|uniref:alpha-galactosidase n=1 Tax=Streptosporangium sp. NBC_01639 TaxID=2975948 RepID=UPI003870B175|nr:alpha-galactosidase [Streptosporangium sp. NBC_01639]